MNNSVKILCIVRRAKPPPPSAGPAHTTDPPRRTAKKRSKKRSQNSSAKERLKSRPNGSQVAPLSPSRRPFRAPRGSPDPQKPSKPYGKPMFLRYPQNRPWTPSGRSFCPPGTPNEPPSRQKAGKGSQKGLHLELFCFLFFALFRHWLPHGSREGARALPGTQKRPKLVENRRPDTKIISKKRPEAHKTRSQTEQPKC